MPISRMAYLVSPELRWLAAQLTPFLRIHLASQACIMLGSVLVLLDPLIMKWLIDDVLAKRRADWLPLVAAAFVVNYVARRILEYAGAMLNVRGVQQLMLRTRLQLLRRLHRLSAAYHEEHPAGDTLHRLDHDVGQIGTLGADLIPSVVRMITIGSFVLATMLVLNARLTALVVPLIPAFVLIRRRYRTELQSRADLVQTHAGAVTVFLQDHLPVIVQIQLLERERAVARRFAQLAAQTVRTEIERRRAELVFGSLLYLVVIIGMASVLGYGGHQVLTGALSTGSLVAFYGYTLQLFIPLYTLVDVYARLQRVSASVRRVRQVAEAPETVVERPDAVDLPHGNSMSVAFERVAFRYRTGQQVLLEADLRVGPGEKVALVGASGSGKSTIARLIARLYDVDAGVVRVAGHDVRDVTLRSLRAAVIYVPQEPVLFDATLAENLRYGRPHATDAELEEVAVWTALGPVVERQPRGWNEPLGPRGARLSGGERQRVALARALLQRPRVLILDESTSALDVVTERRVFAGLAAALKGVTMLLISHRPSTLRWVDRVLFLRSGRLIDGRFAWHRFDKDDQYPQYRRMK